MLSGGEGLLLPQEDSKMTSDKKQKIYDILQKGWDTFHKYFVYVLLATALGVGVGVKVSQKFYSDKMDESVLVQGLVYKGKPYNLTPR